MTDLAIKNMVCDRCLKVVREELEAAGYTLLHLQLGLARLAEDLQASDVMQIDRILEKNGFERIPDEDSQLIDRVKTLIVGHIHHRKKKPEELNYSDWLAREMGMNYFSLSKLFSTGAGLTIERYIILQKIERVKELLQYDQQSLSEIAYDLEYSSLAHLSGQFKKVTGMSPSQFKNRKENGRSGLDKF